MTTMAEHEAKIKAQTAPEILSHSEWLRDMAQNDGVFSDEDAGRMVDLANALRFRPELDLLGNFNFKIGGTYPTRGGRLVTIVRKTDTKGYECVQGDDMVITSGYRYARSTGTHDHGRCTGGEGDDLCNLIPIEITDERITGPRQWEERRLLVLSTAHLRADTAKMLTDTDPKDWCFAGDHYGEYGFFVYALHKEDHIKDSWKLPKELQDVMAFARRNGFTNILFDRDADAIEELPSWEW
ncbi:DUF5983 family protein [Agrobacterium sp. CG674]